MSTQRFAGRLKLDLTTLQASQETCGYTSTVPNLRESAQMRKSVYENSQRSEQVSASLQKCMDRTGSNFQKTSMGFFG